jgi:hypothetical protein
MITFPIIYKGSRYLNQTSARISPAIKEVRQSRDKQAEEEYEKSPSPQLFWRMTLQGKKYIGLLGYRLQLCQFIDQQAQEMALAAETGIRHSKQSQDRMSANADYWKALDKLYKELSIQGDQMKKKSGS